jgi:hypothetical protein
MWEYLARVFMWWLLSIVKFLVAPFSMIFNPGPEKWSLVETIAITSSGAALGVFIFFHFGEIIFDWLAHHFQTKKRIFNRRNRFFIRIKHKWGFKGLLFVSGLISVPIASMVGAKLYRHNPNALPMLIIAFFCWSVLLSSIAYGLKCIGMAAV